MAISLDDGLVVGDLVDGSHLGSSWNFRLPWVGEVLVESFLEVGWVKLLIMEPEADVEEEGDESKDWHDHTNSLPVTGVTSIGVINIILGVADQQDPEHRWDEELNQKRPVCAESTFPPLNLVVHSAHLGH